MDNMDSSDRYPLFPCSCDTFVCLPPITEKGSIIFGKNSDRPSGEVQEIIYQPHAIHPEGSKIRCTYIEIEQIHETAAVILSKPSWMWGAEMGANEYGICIGNEAVWTRLNSDDDKIERLLGMDLVRLGLERAKTAVEALNVITELLALHGQGGPCSDTMEDFTYHNSFLIADRKEAWVLETAGELWAAEHITSGYRHISNQLSIGTKIDRMSEGLKEKAVSLGYWNPEVQKGFHFAKNFSDGGYQESGRIKGAKRILAKFSTENSFGLQSMMELLRDEKSGICMCYEDSFQTTSSQVSVLPQEASSRLCCHWFTGTPDPSVSVFKPFAFSDDTSNFQLTPDTKSPTPPTASPIGRKTKINAAQHDRAHALYKAHKKCYYSKLGRPGTAGSSVKNQLRQLECDLIEKTEAALEKVETGNANADCKQQLENLFNHAVHAELDIYNFYYVNQ